MNANKKVNIILINALPIHDLMPTSCVNNEVVKFNRQLKIIVKLHGNVVSRNRITKKALH
jgi:hypothetical protein